MWCYLMIKDPEFVIFLAFKVEEARYQSPQLSDHLGRHILHILYGQVLFYCTPFYCALQILCSSQIELFWQSCVEMSNKHQFSFFLIYFLLVFNLLTYRITPSARHPFTPSPRPPPLLPLLVRFPELGVFTFCLPF